MIWCQHVHHYLHKSVTSNFSKNYSANSTVRVNNRPTDKLNRYNDTPTIIMVATNTSAELNTADLLFNSTVRKLNFTQRRTRSSAAKSSDLSLRPSERSSTSLRGTAMRPRALPEGHQFG